MSSIESILSDEQWWNYQQQGYLKLGKLLDGAELTALQDRINAIMLDKVPNDRFMMQLDKGGAYSDMAAMTLGSKGPTLEYRKIENLEFDPLFLSYMQRPIFRDICAWHYGAHADVACFRAMFMNKPARKGTILPWHQDGGDSWSLDRDPLVTLWTALDPATIDNGCVQIIPGSHKLGLLSKRGHTITEEQVQQYCPDNKIVYLELKPGESVLLHNWLLHRSDVNKTDISRRAFSVCYMDARTRRNGSEAFSKIFGEKALKVEELEPALA